MTIEVKHIPTYHKPLWYFAESPYRITSIWEWQSVPDSADEDGILLDDPRINAGGEDVEIPERPF